MKGFSGKRWPQDESEITGFIELLVAEKIRSYLEIGCRNGDTFHAVGSRLPVGSLLVAVDKPKRVGSSEAFLEAAASDLRARGREAVVIFGDSHAPETVERVRGHGPFDAVFIDGDHSEAGVNADWQNYGPMGRIVAFHDVRGKQIPTFPMQTFVRARAGRRWIEFCESAHYGIGVLWR